MWTSNEIKKSASLYNWSFFLVSMNARCEQVNKSDNDQFHTSDYCSGFPWFANFNAIKYICERVFFSQRLGFWRNVFWSSMLAGALQMTFGSKTHSTTATLQDHKCICEDVARGNHFFSTKWPNARRNKQFHIQSRKSPYQNEADASREREIFIKNASKRLVIHAFPTQKRSRHECFEKWRAQTLDGLHFFLFCFLMFFHKPWKTNNLTKRSMGSKKPGSAPEGANFFQETVPMWTSRAESRFSHFTPLFSPFFRPKSLSTWARPKHRLQCSSQDLCSLAKKTSRWNHFSSSFAPRCVWKMEVLLSTLSFPSGCYGSVSPLFAANNPPPPLPPP